VKKNTLDDIKKLGLGDALRAIRKRAHMYSKDPQNPLRDVVSGITEEFERLGVSEHCVNETSDFVMIMAKQDWLDSDVQRAPIEDYFNIMMSPVSYVNGIRSEIFLKAFYFSFLTDGSAGRYGDPDLLDRFSGSNPSQYIGSNGRFLLISKQQNFPKNHGINYDKPTQTEAELKNEKMWKKLVRTPEGKA